MRCVWFCLVLMTAALATSAATAYTSEIEASSWCYADWEERSTGFLDQRTAPGPTSCTLAQEPGVTTSAWATSALPDPMRVQLELRTEAQVSDPALLVLAGTQSKLDLVVHDTLQIDAYDPFGGSLEYFPGTVTVRLRWTGTVSPCLTPSCGFERDDDGGTFSIIPDSATSAALRVGASFGDQEQFDIAVSLDIGTYFDDIDYDRVDLQEELEFEFDVVFGVPVDFSFWVRAGSSAELSYEAEVGAEVVAQVEWLGITDAYSPYSPIASVSAIGADGLDWALPVPEPSTGALTALGLVAVTVMRRRSGAAWSGRWDSNPRR